ncbi:MAG: hypothetical protein CL811_06530 [Colwelliaceae bacterium]|jgi:hypothetical protein|nr:hypothetical protein [Colwelliaceae bacterium]|tara:strand:- start:24 stop:245 length:222 start_codon:yes stop_codon:yes gene_type:complete
MIKPEDIDVSDLKQQLLLDMNTTSNKEDIQKFLADKLNEVEKRITESADIIFRKEVLITKSKTKLIIKEVFCK